MNRLSCVILVAFAVVASAFKMNMKMGEFGTGMAWKMNNSGRRNSPWLLHLLTRVHDVLAFLALRSLFFFFF